MGLSENVVYPLNPVWLMIIIPMKNGYFIGNIPYFQTHPDHFMKLKMGWSEIGYSATPILSEKSMSVHHHILHEITIFPQKNTIFSCSFHFQPPHASKTPITPSRVSPVSPVSCPAYSQQSPPHPKHSCAVGMLDDLAPKRTTFPCLHRWVQS